jgi:pimeloyl-ACP methyl ester carboxylesterase
MYGCAEFFALPVLTTLPNAAAANARADGQTGTPQPDYYGAIAAKNALELANDAEALIEALGLTRYVLIGHSMGGKVAAAGGQTARGLGSIDLGRTGASDSNGGT